MLKLDTLVLCKIWELLSPSDWKNLLLTSKFFKKKMSESSFVRTIHTPTKTYSVNYRDRREGVYIRYHYEHTLSHRYNFKDGLKHGIVEKFNPSGYRIKTGYYILGNPCNDITYFYPYGTIRDSYIYLPDKYRVIHLGEFRRTYIDGLLDGIVIHENVWRTKLGRYRFKQGRLDGEYIDYIKGTGTVYRNGIDFLDKFDLKLNPKFYVMDPEYKSLVNNRGRLNGEVKYYENSCLRQICTYKDGVMDGIQSIYNSKGKLKGYCMYSQGKRIHSWLDRINFGIRWWGKIKNWFTLYPKFVLG